MKKAYDNVLYQIIITSTEGNPKVFYKTRQSNNN